MNMNVKSLSVKELRDLIPATAYVQSEVAERDQENVLHLEWLDNQISRIRSLFSSRGRLNSKSKYLEEYALSWLASGNPTRALECFDTRAKKRPEGLVGILFRHDPPANGAYHSERISPNQTKLGYDGVLAYAKLCAKAGRPADAIVLLRQTVDIPVECPPLSLYGARVNAIRALIPLSSKGDQALLREALKVADHHNP